MSGSVLGRGLLRLLALAGSDFAATTCARCSRPRRCSTVGVASSRGALGALLAPRPGSCAASTNGARASARYAASLADDEAGAAQRAQVDALAAFVAGLAADLDPDRLPRTWSGLAKFAHRLVRRFFGDERRRESWPPFEQVAARRVEAVLDRLGTLDAIDPGPTLEVFRRTFELELDAARDRVGQLGDGVLVGPVSMALGVDLDRLWVCGLAEGLFPSVPRDDPLLADRERAVLGGALRLRSDRVADDERGLLAALASTSGARVLHVSPRRPPAQHRARAVAVPRRHARGRRRHPVDRVVRVRRRPGSVPREPPRARSAGGGGGRRVGRGRTGGGARAGAHAGPGRLRVHPLRREPRGAGRPAAGNQPRGVRPGDVADAAADVGGVPARVLHGNGAARRRGRTARGDHGARADRPGHAGARGARPVPRRSA